MFDGYDIAGNRQVFADLVDLLGTGKAVGFVGAGASAQFYPLWSQLIEKLAEQATDASPEQQAFWKKKAARDPVGTAKQIRRFSDEGSFTQAIRELFAPRDGGASTATQKALLQLPFAAFVTTNYDPGLDLACLALRKDRRPVPFTWRDDRTSLWGKGPPEELEILHAHGRYDRSDTIVLDIDDYRNIYGHEGPYSALLERLFVQESLVFVGFSFTDLWLKSFADRALTRSGIRLTSGPLHFAIVPLAEDELADADFHAVELRESLRTRCLFYPVRGGDHGALGKLLAALIAEVDRGSAAAPAPSPAKKGAAPTALLELYFDHLCAAHRRLVKGFDRPGRLDLIEEAWVEVEVATDTPARFADAGKEWLGRSIPLERALELRPSDAPWITGRWLLEGPPGSGKTTLLRRLAATLARDRRRERIPVFLPLPRLVGQPATWLEVATEGFAAVGAAALVDEFELAGSEGRLVILLDGLDEVPPDRRNGITTLLDLLTRQYPGCQILLSSRPLGRGEPPEGFPRLSLQPLPVEQQRLFLIKWLSEAGRSPAEAEASAERALQAFTQVRGLGDLAGTPLYLTLLAEIWQAGEALPERLAGIYDRIFDFLLSGKHRRDPKSIRNPEDVREALAFLAFGMTEDDLWAESPARLERRLRATELAPVRARLETVSAWRDNLDTFLHDVYEETQILGPHDGRELDWRYWHRTFREALTAELLLAKHRQGGEKALAAWAQNLEGDEGRWAEPLALLAGRLAEPDALVRALAEVKSGLALRAMVFTEGLAVDTLVHTLGLTEDMGERAQVFAAIPDQLGEPLACLALVEKLLAGRPGGFDLFWLGHILDEVGTRWPYSAPASRRLAERLFAHLPKPEPALFSTVKTKLDGEVPLWRTIPAGKGLIGSPEDEQERYGDEGPQHELTVSSDFALGAVPVTNAQYAAFDAARADLTRPAHPVVYISWYEAMAFCRWLGTLPGLEGARLPTEEEWEYACRAGSRTRFLNGDAEANLAAVGWYDGNSGRQELHAVGEKPANLWGLYDLHGNVREWTISAWKDDYSGQAGGLVADPAAPAADLAGPSSPAVGRVVRGGSLWDSARRARSAYRYHGDPADLWNDRGFRVALPRPPARRSSVDL